MVARTTILFRVGCSGVEFLYNPIIMKFFKSEIIWVIAGFLIVGYIVFIYESDDPKGGSRHTGEGIGDLQEREPPEYERPERE